MLEENRGACCAWVQTEFVCARDQYLVMVCRCGAEMVEVKFHVLDTCELNSVGSSTARPVSEFSAATHFQSIYFEHTGNKFAESTKSVD